MAVVLRLNRGSTYGTIDLNDGTNYKVLDAYIPRVATRKATQFGGKPYNRVTEGIPLYIKGTTAAQVLEKLEDIVAALEQAYAWRKGAQVDPVILEYLPHGTSLSTVLQSAVWGAPINAQDLFEMANFGMYMAGNSFETMITLNLVRDGLWLGDDETPAASSAVANPGKMTVTFADEARLPSPVKITLETTQTPNVEGAKGFVLIADQADKIYVLSTSVMTPVTDTWSTETDADAEGGSFRRTDSVSGEQTLGYAALSGSVNASARMWAVYAALRNLSTDIAWSVRVRLWGAKSSAFTRPVILENNNANYPRVQFLGFASLSESLIGIRLLATPGAGAASGDELDVDYFILQAVDEFTGALAFDTTVDNPDAPVGVDTVIVDDRSLLSPKPRLTINASFPPWSGNAYFLSVGDSLTALICGTWPDATGLWTLVENLSTDKLEFTLTATRRLGYLTPR